MKKKTPVVRQDEVATGYKGLGEANRTMVGDEWKTSGASLYEVTEKGDRV